jgi:uncharacterized protein (DUF488 family)
MSLAEFYTIGHSNRSIEAFIHLLEHVRADVLIDVRTIPKSRHNPQFNADAVAKSLQDVSIAYRRVPELGGLRSARKGQGASPNGFWENDSFRNYADYTETPPFKAGLTELRSLGNSNVCAVMCAEALWWCCHRRIISDYLLAAGEKVIHIIGEDKLEPAHLTEAAVIGPDDTITYPGSQGELSL